MVKKISLAEANFSIISIGDDIGRVFFWQNRIFRAIRHDAVEIVRDIFSSGMLKELVDSNFFPKSWITDFKIDNYALVIEHEKIHPVVYPHEWSFSMLKDAAVAVLKINLIAKKYNYQTKDCHGYNVLFDGPHIKFIDLGSFTKIDNTKGWIAFEQFKRCYYYPLRIWSSGNDYIARRMLLGWERMPLDSYLLYKNPFFRLLNLDFLKRMTSLYFGFRSISLLSSSVIKNRFPGYLGDLIIYLKNKNLLPLQSVKFLSMIKEIQKISRKKQKTIWGCYHDSYYNEDGELTSISRFDRIISIIKDLGIKSVVELGGNQGVLSRLLLEHTNVENVICTDSDDSAIETCYLYSKKYNNLTVANLDFIVPNIEARTESPGSRYKSDAVLVLAVTHHLILTQKISIDVIFQTISMYSKRYVFIEFMPLGLWDKKSAPPVPSWYNISWFRNSFEKYFRLILEEKIEENRILLVGELNKIKRDNYFEYYLPAEREL